MPSCPECSGEMKWNPPFYNCTICGLAMRKFELARAKEALRMKSRKYSKVDEDETEKDRRRKDYMRWYNKEE
ncbi:MAG: hypothetical protein ACTSP4_09460 [Candidatus Hodarchaeales archaeon]